MPVEYGDYASDDEEESSPVQVRKQNLNVQDEEAFPDFGGAAGPAAPAINYAAAWSSSKAPAAMPQPVARKRTAPTPAAAVAAPAAEFGAARPAVEAKTGAGVPWSDNEWQKSDSKTNQPAWTQTNKINTLYQQAFASCRVTEDPYAAGSSQDYSTVPKKVVKPTSQAAPSAADTAEPVEVKKEKKEKKKKVKGEDGFTEVRAPEREKKEKEKKGPPSPQLSAATKVSTSLYAALEDPNEQQQEVKQEGGKKKKSKAAKPEQTQEKSSKEPEVQVDTRPKKKKEKKKKSTDDDEFLTKAEKQGKKGEAGGLPVTMVGAALVAVAGVAFYFSTQ